MDQIPRPVGWANPSAIRAKLPLELRLNQPTQMAHSPNVRPMCLLKIGTLYDVYGNQCGRVGQAEKASLRGSRAVNELRFAPALACQHGVLPETLAQDGGITPGYAQRKHASFRLPV